MSEPYKIEKGVPLPKGSGRGHGPLTEAVLKMEVNDSIFIPHQKPIGGQRTHWRNVHGIVVRVVKEGTGQRLWRVK